MQTPPIDIDLLLPFGEFLRGYMEQSFISSADLKHILRARGVFTSRTEKRDTIPALACCLLSPAEFDELRECQANREDNPKGLTQTVAWGSSKALLAAVPKDLCLSDVLQDEYANFKIIGSPSFIPVQGDVDNIVCEFEIEREDLSRCWAATKSNFKGKLRIEKAAGGRSVKFFLTSTAEETKELNRRLVRFLKQRFQESGDVAPEAELETILFSSFDNSGRIAFFLSLLQFEAASGFEFAGITDFGACPDKRTRLPKEVKWMEGKVRGLKISGVALENTFFFENRELHEFLQLYSILAKFRFQFGGMKGSCSVTFEFPDFASRADFAAELEINISALTLDSTAPLADKVAAKEELLRRVNDHKLTQFGKHRRVEGKAAVISAPASLLPSRQLDLLMADPSASCDGAAGKELL